MYTTHASCHLRWTEMQCFFSTLAFTMQILVSRGAIGYCCCLVDTFDLEGLSECDLAVKHLVQPWIEHLGRVISRIGHEHPN